MSLTHLFTYLLFFEKEKQISMLMLVTEKYLASKTCISKTSDEALKFNVCNFCYKTIWNVSYIEFFFNSTNYFTVGYIAHTILEE